MTTTPTPIAQYGRPQQCLLQISEPAAPARTFPAMTPDLERILGTMCFQTIKLAKVLPEDGQDIATRAEAEQAPALHWMLSLWSKAHYWKACVKARKS